MDENKKWDLNFDVSTGNLIKIVKMYTLYSVYILYLQRDGMIHMFTIHIVTKVVWVRGGVCLKCVSRREASQNI